MFNINCFIFILHKAVIRLSTSRIFFILLPEILSKRVFFYATKENDTIHRYKLRSVLHSMSTENL